jgi:hypothetical protein
MSALTLRIALAALLVGSGIPLSSSQQGTGDFQLSLIRDYGRALYLECRLDIVMFAAKGQAWLRCSYAGKDGRGRSIPPLTAHEEMAPAEAKQLGDLVKQSALYESGEHVGTDNTPSDGIFEVLKLRASTRTVVVVTSGNPSFAQKPARKELLSLLTRIEKRLADRGKAK